MKTRFIEKVGHIVRVVEEIYNEVKLKLGDNYKGYTVCGMTLSKDYIEYTLELTLD